MHETTEKQKSHIFTKFNCKLWSKTLLKYAYKCSLGLVFNFFKYRLLFAYYALISFNIVAFFISVMEWGLYLFLAYQLVKDAFEVTLSFFN